MSGDAPQARYEVERSFGSRQHWFGGKILRYRGLANAHAWHVLLAMAYNLKRLPDLLVSSRLA
ncbi:transposase [Methylomonas sp. MgM2]